MYRRLIVFLILPVATSADSKELFSIDPEGIKSAGLAAAYEANPDLDPGILEDKLQGPCP